MEIRKQVIEQVEKNKIIAIVRGAGAEQCLKAARALYDGGIRLMEITYDQSDPEGWGETAQVIERIAEEFEGRMLVGAGTVTTPELVELTEKSKGKFIISPDTNVEVIRRTRELGLVSMPGAMTCSEIMTAHRAGADFVKVFPINNLGPSYLKALRAPLSHIRMMAVGGVNENNIREYLEAGAVGAGVGGNLANRTWMEAGRYDKITETARLLVAAAQLQ